MAFVWELPSSKSKLPVYYLDALGKSLDFYSESYDK